MWLGWSMWQHQRKICIEDLLGWHAFKLVGGEHYSYLWTRLQWNLSITPLGAHEVSWLKRCYLFQRLFSTLLYVVETKNSVQIKGVCLIRMSLIVRFHCVVLTIWAVDLSQVEDAMAFHTAHKMWPLYHQDKYPIHIMSWLVDSWPQISQWKFMWYIHELFKWNRNSPM